MRKWLNALGSQSRYGGTKAGEVQLARSDGLQLNSYIKFGYSIRSQIPPVFK